MKLKINLITGLLLTSTAIISHAQVMSPELLWSLKRLSSEGITIDGNSLIIKSTTPDISNNSFNSKYFQIDLASGRATSITTTDGLIKSTSVNSEGFIIAEKQVKMKAISGSDLYSKLGRSDAMVYDQLHYRHWDKWEDGYYGHLFLVSNKGDSIDLMKNEPYDCPTVPFGGSGDYTWAPDGKSIVYVCKKNFGTDYVNSTNTDLYQYNLSTKLTTNITESNKGYDTNPVFSSKGQLAWLSMDEASNEADKNDIIVKLAETHLNLTKDWDGTVDGFVWSTDANTIYFNAPIGGTIQLFSVDIPAKAGAKSEIKQITDGVWDIADIVGETSRGIVVGRTDMNHAKEYFLVDPKDGNMKALTYANKTAYDGIKMGKIEKRIIKTTDNKDMVTWIIYPPDFDATKQYPTLLYAQGGPQSALSQFYSFRWNFQLMAAQGYIVIAPNRRGMPGHGVEWNAAISGDWGGQAMRDYLSAADALIAEPFVDKKRVGVVGASFGGYSVFYLAGTHNGRFKTFIAHDGVFNLKSMYGTTEELFFVNHDAGGPYWEKNNTTAQKTYREFDPSNMVDKWDTPILIIQGGRDYRVPIGQGLEAFTAAQQKGIKSRLLYFPEENHWVLKPQNALVWQGEFFRWLTETL